MMSAKEWKKEEMTGTIKNEIGTQTGNITEQQENRKNTKKKNNEITGGVYCCNTIMRIKKNNVFINITKLNGQTIVKYSTGLIQKKKK